jgi:hypothetical protein
LSDVLSARLFRTIVHRFGRLGRFPFRGGKLDKPSLPSGLVLYIEIVPARLPFALGGNPNGPERRLGVTLGSASFKGFELTSLFERQSDEN